jgi:hypothetical protein
VNNIAKFRAGGSIEGELSSQNIGKLLRTFASTSNSSGIVHQLVASINGKAEYPDPAHDLAQSETSEIEILLHIIAV